MPTAPHVLLIGDSISIGYHDAAVGGLDGVADVGRIPENGGTSANILEHFEDWVAAVQPDLVHLNCGLHDLARHAARDGQPRVAAEAYARNVRSIVQRVRAETAATLIWASTTPVNDARHRRLKKFERRQADVIAYNAAADKVMDEMGVPINDLHALVAEAGADRLLGPDGVHFGDEGYRRLGAAVAIAVRNALVIEGLAAS